MFASQDSQEAHLADTLPTMATVAGSLALGLVGGMLGWTLAQLLLVPRLRWSPQLRRRVSTTDPSEIAYRLKLKNATWLRPFVDARIQARIAFSDPGAGGAQTWRMNRSIDLGTQPTEIKILRPRAHELVSIYANRLAPSTRSDLSDWGYGHVADKPGLTVEDLLHSLPDSYLSIQVLGSDGWTGTLKHRESPRYRLSGVPYPFVDDHFMVKRSGVDRLRHAINKR